MDGRPSPCEYIESYPKTNIKPSSYTHPYTGVCRRRRVYVWLCYCVNGDVFHELPRRRQVSTRQEPYESIDFTGRLGRRRLSRNRARRARPARPAAGTCSCHRGRLAAFPRQRRGGRLLRRRGPLLVDSSAVHEPPCAMRARELSSCLRAAVWAPCRPVPLHREPPHDAARSAWATCS